MTAEPSRDDAKTSWQVLAPLIDLVTPMAVRVAATLRLADRLRNGPLPITDLAASADCDPDALARLLRHLIGHGMFAEPDPGIVALTDTAALLDSEHPSGMQVSLDLTGFGGRMDLAFTELLHTVRTGEPSWERVFGAPFWQYLADEPRMAASFDAVMSAGAEYVRDDLAAFDWSAARHLVDVGAGTGALIEAVLRAHPDVRATLVDLPATAARGRARLVAAGLEARVDIVGQSFFDPLPAGGDVYVLNSVLHDWADQDAAAILRRCADAAGEQGQVVLIEEHGTEGRDHAEMNLRMLVLCGGRERTVDDYARLGREAGLTVTGVRTTPLGQVGIALSRGLPPRTGAAASPPPGA